MKDDTEMIRREMVNEINSEVVSNEPDAERARLAAAFGAVYDTKQLSSLFEVVGFMAPFVMVRSKKTGKTGTLEFQHSPRFYFNYMED